LQFRKKCTRISSTPHNIYQPKNENDVHAAPGGERRGAGGAAAPHSGDDWWHRSKRVALKYQLVQGDLESPGAASSYLWQNVGAAEWHAGSVAARAVLQGVRGKT